MVAEEDSNVIHEKQENLYQFLFQEQQGSCIGKDFNLLQ